MSKKILVIDDDASVCALMKDLLEQRGHEVSAASNAESALEKAQLVPDLIVLDIMLPGADGWDLMKKFKSESRTRAIPIIVCSTIPGKESSRKARDLGAVDFITKPFGLLEFTMRVEAAFGT